jgi:F0F1-type ATP synthase assembly protein I
MKREGGMTMKKTLRDRKDRAALNNVVMVSAWGFIMVISSFAFTYTGRLIDVNFNTEPAFMIGMLLLGVTLCVIRMYKEAVERTRRIYRRDSTA